MFVVLGGDLRGQQELLMIMSDGGTNAWSLDGMFVAGSANCKPPLTCFGFAVQITQRRLVATSVSRDICQVTFYSAFLKCASSPLIDSSQDPLST